MSKYTIGIDLGDRKHAVCVLNDEGVAESQETIGNTRTELIELSSRYPGAVIVVETSSHSPWISRLFEARGHLVHVANSRKVSYISRSNNKHDRDDAQCLARLGRVDPSLLHPVKHRSEECQRDLIRIKVRDALVRARVNLMNSVRFLLKGLGVRVPSSVKATVFVRETRECVAAEYLSLVDGLLISIDALNERIKKEDKDLAQITESKYPQARNLESIPGVGPLTALCFVLVVADEKRFRKARDVGPVLGLVPRRDQSGESDKQLPITKAGNGQLRCLLVNCAHYIMGPFGPPSRLRAGALRIAERGGKNAKKRAVVACARKLAVTMMAMWQQNTPYVPEPIAA